MVLATQNPIEQEGTYPLPEAQLDRFFFKLLVGYSNRDELSEILDRTTTGAEAKTDFSNGMAIYQITDKGLMAFADIAGTKYWKNKKLNK